MDILGIEVDGLLQLVYLLQDGHRHLQNEQRRLHVEVQQLHANLRVLGQGIQQQREDDVKNALCVMKDILEDMARSRDEQGAEANPPRNSKRMIKALEEALEVRNANPAESDLYARQQGPRRERLWEIRQVQVLSPKHLVSPMVVLRTLLWYNRLSVLKREMLT